MLAVRMASASLRNRSFSSTSFCCASLIRLDSCSTCSPEAQPHRIAISHEHTDTLTHTLTHSHTLTHTHSHSLTLTHTHTHSHSLTLTHSHTRAQRGATSCPCLLPKKRNDVNMPVKGSGMQRGPAPLIAAFQVCVIADQNLKAHPVAVRCCLVGGGAPWSQTYGGREEGRN